MSASFAPFVAVEALAKRYGPERILDGVNFALPRESVLAILGLHHVKARAFQRHQQHFPHHARIINGENTHAHDAASSVK